MQNLYLKLDLCLPNCSVRGRTTGWGEEKKNKKKNNSFPNYHIYLKFVYKEPE